MHDSIDDKADEANLGEKEIYIFVHHQHKK